MSAFPVTCRILRVAASPRRPLPRIPGPWSPSGRLTTLLLSTTLLTACATLPPCPVPSVDAPPIPIAELDSSLFLIGDAGIPAGNGEPILDAMAAELTRALEALGSDRVLAAYLGDNLYPDGLTGRGEKRRELERRLDAQLAVLQAAPGGAEAEGSGPTGIFVPGNHDWGGGRADGLERVRAQAHYLAREGEGRAAMLPANGCPGPAVIDRGDRLRLIALDTHWWLRHGPVAKGPADGCERATQAEVLEGLETALADAGDRLSVVAGHHPLDSGGPHGGHSLWLRRIGLFPQDLPHRNYRDLKQRLEAVFAHHPPAVYAAGHEHSMQILRGHGYPLQVVSGAGSAGNVTAVGAIQETLTCREEAGFVRLDLARDGRLRLGLIVAGSDAEPREVYATVISP